MKKLLLVSSLMLSSVLFGQVGVGTTSPEKSSILNVESPNKDKGFIIPRMNTVECKAIVNPANGLQVYVTDAIGLKPDWVKVGDKYVYKPTEYHGRVCTYDGQHWVYIKNITVL